jgi:hypothetical protein
MILNQIIGPCPNCHKPASFGNLGVSRQLLTRACKSCDFTQRLPLPPLSKTIIYLDQFFYSHAFRNASSDFNAAISLMNHLAHHQLIVVPFSPTHRTETHQWPNETRMQLWKFIRHTSRGHQLLPVYHAKHAQILRSYRSYLDGGPVFVPVQNSDVFHEDVDEWEDYVRVDVEIDRDDTEQIRASKSKTVDDLLSLFAAWRGQTSDFADDLEAEIKASANNYLQHFARLLVRVGVGDTTALVDPHIDSMVIESMVRNTHTTTDPIERLNKAMAFFSSNYFRNVPYEKISKGILAVLKHRVKMGQYSNPDKAKEALSGFVFDLEFISGYLPYCDAMFIDQAMYDMLTDSRLTITQDYGTKIFSRSSWDKLIDFLASIEKGLSAEIRRAISWVYPKQVVDIEA